MVIVFLHPKSLDQLCARDWFTCPPHIYLWVDKNNNVLKNINIVENFLILSLHHD